MKANLKLVLSLVVRLGSSVAIPTVGLAYLGSRLDAAYNKDYFTLIGLGVAFVLSMTLVYYIAKTVAEEAAK